MVGCNLEESIPPGRDSRQPEPWEVTGPSAAGQRILVVDDDPSIRHLVTMVLRRQGYSVETAADGSEALERIEVVRPHLLLLDLMMPVVTGWQVIDQLLKLGDAPPVIVMSANDGLRAATLPPLVSGWLAKPFTIAELLRVCRDALSQQ